MIPVTAIYCARGLVVLLLLFLWRRWTMSKDAGEPPTVPYWIPFLGHAWAFVNDINGFAAKIAAWRPGQITTAYLAGQRLYVVLDPAAASTLYRRSRDFTFDPFSMQVARALGSTEAEMRIWERGTWGHELPRGETGLYHETLHMLPEELTGAPLEDITKVFVRCLRGQIRRQVQEMGDAGTTVDLVEWMKRAVTMASSEAMFGTRFVETWPTLYEDYWAFDPKMQSLMFGLPRWMNRRAYQVRDRCLDKIKEWERAALRSSAMGDAPPLNDWTTVWDEHWGMKLVRRRLHMMFAGGIGEEGRATSMIGLLFALNSNAIPTTIWACIMAFTDTELLNTIRGEIAANQVGVAPEDICITTMAKKPHCRSLLLETLRVTTNSPGVRVVTQSTQLGGYTLRPNSLVYIHSLTLQRDSSVWAEPGKPAPDVFWADRFFEGDSSDEQSPSQLATDEGDESTDAIKSTGKIRTVKHKTLSLRPFGGGPTICPGRHFAMNEMLGGLVTLMNQLDVEMDQASLARNGMPEISMTKQGGMFPDRAVYARIRLREGD